MLISKGRVLTFHFQVGEPELTPERLSVVHVNEVVDALLDHVRLGGQRNGTISSSTEQPLSCS